MSPLAILIVGLAMSADAFAAAVAIGTGVRRPTLAMALRLALIFGVVETLTPALGWVLGRTASAWVEQWDHWIALALLSGLGLHMIREGLSDEPRTQRSITDSVGRTALAGLATSLDALAAGVGMAFLDVDVVALALTIGACTFVAVAIGVWAGSRLRERAGQRAEIAGGAMLIAVGIGIVVQHTG